MFALDGHAEYSQSIDRKATISTIQQWIESAVVLVGRNVSGGLADIFYPLVWERG